MLIRFVSAGWLFQKEKKNILLLLCWKNGYVLLIGRLAGCRNDAQSRSCRDFVFHIAANRRICKLLDPTIGIVMGIQAYLFALVKYHA